MSNRRNLIILIRIIIIAISFGFVVGALIFGLAIGSSYRSEIRVLEEKIEELSASIDNHTESLEELLNGPQRTFTEMLIPALPIEGIEGINESAIAGGNENAGNLAIDRPWYLQLINHWNPLEADFTVELEEVEAGILLDTRIVEPAREMLAAARAEGLNPRVVSGYRSYADQERVFDETMIRWNSQGLSWLEAFHETRLWVKLPGHSEHNAGLAIDIISANRDGLDEGQAETPEVAWLMENSWRFGFILRYPPGTLEITGITFEPWHFRYVGLDAAREITERGITLEEFLLLPSP